MPPELTTSTGVPKPAGASDTGMPPLETRVMAGIRLTCQEKCYHFFLILFVKFPLCLDLPGESHCMMLHKDRVFQSLNVRSRLLDRGQRLRHSAERGTVVCSLGRDRKVRNRLDGLP